MTDQAAVYRPSPRPRLAGAATRPADERRLHAVPDATLQSETATAGHPPVSEDPQVSDLGTPLILQSATGFRARLASIWTASKAYWTPPGVFTDPAPSLAELAEYAKAAPWTHQQAGFIRALGIGYYRYVAYPKTVKNRYSEWAWQRPLRLAAHAGAIKLISMTGPGDWVVHHIVYPAAQVAGHVFL